MRSSLFASVKRCLFEIFVVVAFLVVCTMTYHRVAYELQSEKIVSEDLRMETFVHSDQIKRILANQLNCLATFDGLSEGVQLGPTPPFSLNFEGKKKYTTGERVGQSDLRVDSYRLTNANASLIDRRYELLITFKDSKGTTFQRSVALRVNDNRSPIGPSNPCAATSSGGSN